MERVSELKILSRDCPSKAWLEEPGLEKGKAGWVGSSSHPTEDGPFHRVPVSVPSGLPGTAEGWSWWEFLFLESHSPGDPQKDASKPS